MEGTLAAGWALEGYAKADEVSAVLPWQVFEVDLEVGIERELGAADRAVLELVVAGVGDPHELARLLGLADGRLVAMAVTRLARRAAIVRGETGLVATISGQSLARAGTAMCVERTTETLHHDLVRRRFDWRGRRQVRDAGRWAVRLPPIKPLGALDVERATPKLQALVRDRGVPSIDRDDRRPKKERPRRELRALRVFSSALHWREVRLEVWRHETTSHERLRVCSRSTEDRDATDRYHGHRFDPRSRRVVETG